VSSVAVFFDDGLLVGPGSTGMHYYRSLRKYVALERAETMMSDVDRLRVNESSLDDVVRFVRKCNGETRSSQPKGSCQPSDCAADTYVLPAEVYERDSILISIVKRIGVHVFNFRVTTWVEGGRVKAIAKAFFVPRRWAPICT
jgi:hypothetical protein